MGSDQKAGESKSGEEFIVLSINLSSWWFPSQDISHVNILYSLLDEGKETQGNTPSV